MRCAFRFAEGDGVEEQCRWWAFGFAYQKPRLLALVRLQRVDSPIVCFERQGARLSEDPAWDFEWTVEPEYWFSSDDFEPCAEKQVQVVRDLLFVAGRRCFSHARAKPLRDFLDDLPAKRRVAATAGRDATGADADLSVPEQVQLACQHPWALAHVDEGRRFLKKQRAEEPPEDPLDGEDTEEHEDLQAPLLPEDVFGEMEKAHQAVSNDATSFFKVKPLGGMWTAMVLGKVQDAWAGTCIGRDSADFCKKFGLQVQMRFDTSLYGDDGALACARYWVAKHDFWMGLWQEAGCDDAWTVSEQEQLEFVEPPEFTALVETLHARKAQERFAQLRRLQPIPAIAANTT